MTAEERGQVLYTSCWKDIPQLAIAYAKFMGETYGGCGEVLLTSFCHYAQAIEKLKSKQDLYRIGKEGKLWFKEHNRSAR